MRAINEIPHLETASDDIDSRVTILFRNNDSFMVYPEDAEKIQTMTPNVYPLEPVQSGFLSAELEIMAEPLNEPFIKATNQVNQLLKVIRDVLGSRTSQARSLLDRIGLSGQGPNVHLADIDAPAEAARVTATIKLPGMDGLDQEQDPCCRSFQNRKPGGLPPLYSESYDRQSQQAATCCKMGGDSKDQNARNEDARLAGG